MQEDSCRNPWIETVCVVGLKFDEKPMWIIANIVATIFEEWIPELNGNFFPCYVTTVKLFGIHYLLTIFHNFVGTLQKQGLIWRHLVENNLLYG